MVDMTQVDGAKAKVEEALAGAKDKALDVASNFGHGAGIFAELIKAHRILPGSVYATENKANPLSDENKPDAVYAITNDGTLLVNERQKASPTKPNENIWSGWQPTTEEGLGNREISSVLLNAAIKGGDENKGLNFKPLSEDHLKYLNLTVPEQSQSVQKFGMDNLKSVAANVMDQQPELVFAASAMMVGSLVERVANGIGGVVGGLGKVAAVPVSLAGLALAAHTIISKAYNAAKLAGLSDDERQSIKAGADGFLNLEDVGVKNYDNTFRELGNKIRDGVAGMQGDSSALEALKEGAQSAIDAVKGMVAKVRPVSQDVLEPDAAATLTR